MSRHIFECREESREILIVIKLLDFGEGRSIHPMTLPKLEADAAAAPTGVKSAAAGLAYYGYGQYDKAADLLSKGLAKGGLRDEAGTRLLLGISQLKAGHKDDAVKSFKAVKGDPTLERVANLWTLHARAA